MPGRSFTFPFAAMLVGALTLAPAGLQAQDNSDEAAPPDDDKLIRTQEPVQVLVDDIIGMEVRDGEDTSIGTIDSLLFDDEDSIVGGIVSVGGFLGLGAKSVALSWDEFDIRPDEGIAYVSVTREQLEAAPSFRDLETVEAEREAERQRQEMQQQQQQQQQQGSVPTQ